MRALIIDTDPTHHAAFQKGLFRAGFKEICSVFDHESAALVIDDEDKWDIILLGAVPDGEDGLSVARTIAASPLNLRPGLVAATMANGTTRGKAMKVLWDAFVRAVSAPVDEIDDTNLKLLWLPAMMNSVNKPRPDLPKVEAM